MAEISEALLADRIKRASHPLQAVRDSRMRVDFVARLGEVASNPDRVPIEMDGRKIEARRGGTLLAASMKNGIRLMHVCGARTLCATCRVKVESGGENLSPMSALERLSLRYHLSFGSRTRLACQARVLGPVEAEPVFPLCGNLAEAED